MRTPRPATAADWRSILALLEASRLPTDDLAPEHVSRFLVLHEEDRLAGCVAVEPYDKWGLLRSLAVAPEQRGNGLGQRLVETAVERADRDGLTDLALLTTTADEFFRALGWQLVSRDAVPEAVRQSSEFAGTCPASAVCLVRSVEEGHPTYPV